MLIKLQKRQKTSENSKKPKRIEKLLLGLIGSSIYVCSCKKMRYSVKTPLPNKRHKQTNKPTDDLFPLFLCPHLLRLTPNPFPLRERFIFQRNTFKYSCNGCSGSQCI